LPCQDWTNTKAAYPFLANRRVTESSILSVHFHAIRDLAAAASGQILVLHDTNEFTYYGKPVQGLGALQKGFRSAGQELCLVRGILMHSSLAFTTEGLPFGLTAIKFWTRDRFNGTNALKRTINPTRVPIEAKESIRWPELTCPVLS
jgi:hypothetical protein